MNKKIYLWITVVFILLTVLILSPKAFAESSSGLVLELTALSNEVNGGDTIDVNIKVTGEAIASITGLFNYNIDQFEEVTSSNFKISDGFDLTYENSTKVFMITSSAGDYISPENGIIATVTLKAYENTNITDEIYLQGVEIDAENEYYELETKIHISTKSDEELYLLTDKYKIGENNTSIYENGDQYISRVSSETTIDQFLNNLQTNGNITVYNADGTEIQNRNELIKTKMTIKVSKDGYTDINLPISVIGDIDGNGKVTATDLAATTQQVLKDISLEGVQFISADISGDKTVTATDLAAIVQIILKELTI